MDTLPDTTKSNPGTHLIATEPTHPMSTGPTTATLADNTESKPNNRLIHVSTEHSAKSSLLTAATAFV